VGRFQRSNPFPLPPVGTPTKYRLLTLEPSISPPTGPDSHPLRNQEVIGSAPIRAIIPQDRIPPVRGEVTYFSKHNVTVPDYGKAHPGYMDPYTITPVEPLNTQPYPTDIAKMMRTIEYLKKTAGVPFPDDRFIKRGEIDPVTYAYLQQKLESFKVLNTPVSRSYISMKK
jgi:hypothetical protein